MVTALVLLFRLRAAEADHRVRADLLADLLRSSSPDRALVERGRLLGLRLREPHVVVVCRGERPRGLLLAAAQAGTGAGLSGEHADALVALVPGRHPSDVARTLAGKFGVTVGTAGPIVPAEGVARAFAEARTAADALVALGRTGHGAALADLGFVGLVAAEHVDVDAYLARVLGPLLDYDAARGTELVATLGAYFACGASPRRAAQQLHVHANTVAQRLDRIGVLLGADWPEPERALELQLALRVRLVRGAGELRP
jgi:sugar diacid utilization regulator